MIHAELLTCSFFHSVSDGIKLINIFRKLQTESAGIKTSARLIFELDSVRGYLLVTYHLWLFRIVSFSDEDTAQLDEDSGRKARLLSDVTDCCVIALQTKLWN